VFYEYALMPDIFDPTLLFCDGRADLILTELLRGIALNGMIGDLHKGRLQEHIAELVEQIPNADIEKHQASPRNRIIECLQLVKDRNRFVRHPLATRDPANPQEWLDLALQSHKRLKFDGLVMCSDCHGSANLAAFPEAVKLEDSLNAPFWTQRRSDCRLQSKRCGEFARALRPLLRHAKAVTLIDPYINPRERKWMNMVKLVEELTGERGAGNAGWQARIHVHAGNPESDNPPQSVADRLNLWERELGQIRNRFRYTVFLWSMRIDGPSLHDRYVITNQCGLACPGGLDCYDDNSNSAKAKMTSTWSLLGWDTMASQLSEVDENAGVFRLLDKREIRPAP
jgi:hypothetical protein